MIGLGRFSLTLFILLSQVRVLPKTQLRHVTCSLSCTSSGPKFPEVLPLCTLRIQQHRDSVPTNTPGPHNSLPLHMQFPVLGMPFSPPSHPSSPSSCSGKSSCSLSGLSHDLCLAFTLYCTDTLVLAFMGPPCHYPLCVCLSPGTVSSWGSWLCLISVSQYPAQFLVYSGTNKSNK